MPSFKSKAIAGLDSRLRRGAAGAVRKANAVLGQEISRDAPVLTGDLAGSVEVTPVRTSEKTISGAVLITDPNALHQEYGTEEMAAHPFIRPAIASKKTAMKTLIRGTIRSSLGT